MLLHACPALPASSSAPACGLRQHPAEPRLLPAAPPQVLQHTQLPLLQAYPRGRCAGARRAHARTHARDAAACEPPTDPLAACPGARRRCARHTRHVAHAADGDPPPPKKVRRMRACEARHAAAACSPHAGAGLMASPTACCAPGCTQEDPEPSAPSTSAPTPSSEGEQPLAVLPGEDASLRIPKEVIEKLKFTVFGYDTFWVTRWAAGGAGGARHAGAAPPPVPVRRCLLQQPAHT